MTSQEAYDEFMKSIAMLQEQNEARLRNEQYDEDQEEYIRQFNEQLEEIKRQYNITTSLALQEQAQAQSQFEQQQQNALDINKQNIASSEKIANQQMALDERMNNTNINFQREINDLTMQREDNALQRKIADGLKAGLSPLGALGYTGAQTSVLTAPQVNYQGSLNALNSLSGNFINSNNQYGASLNSAFDTFSNARQSNLDRRINALNNRTLQKQQAQNNYMAQKVAIQNQKIQIATLLINSINQFGKSILEYRNTGIQNDYTKALTRQANRKNENEEYSFKSLLVDLLKSNGWTKDKIPNINDVLDNLIGDDTDKPEPPKKPNPLPKPQPPKKPEPKQPKEKPPKLTKEDKRQIKQDKIKYKALADFRDGDNELKISTMKYIESVFKNNGIKLRNDWYYQFMNNKGYRDNILELFDDLYY